MTENSEAVKKIVRQASADMASTVPFVELQAMVMRQGEAQRAAQAEAVDDIMLAIRPAVTEALVRRWPDH
jgi:hypothetical protein